jgi:hypothetical protein
VESFTKPAAAKIGILACILALVAVCLTLSPAPPEDKLFAGLINLIGKHVEGPLEAFAILLLLGAAGYWIGGLILIYLQSRKERDKEFWLWLKEKLVKHGIRLVVLVFLYLLAMYGRTHLPRKSISLPAPPQLVTGFQVKPLPKPASVVPDNSLLPAVSFLVGTVLVLGTGILLLSLWKSQRLPSVAAAPDESALMAAVRHRLELGDQARDAIIACYAEMCEIFAGQNSLSSRHLTAREFAASLRTRGVGEPEILALTAVFEKARYSRDSCNEEDRAQAIHALKILEEHYGHPGGTA